MLITEQKILYCIILATAGSRDIGLNIDLKIGIIVHQEKILYLSFGYIYIYIYIYIYLPFLMHLIPTYPFVQVNLYLLQKKILYQVRSSSSSAFHATKSISSVRRMLVIDLPPMLTVRITIYYIYIFTFSAACFPNISIRTITAKFPSFC